MASAFGAVFQVGYLVEYLMPALDRWVGSCGIGPFFILPPRQFESLSVHGAPAADHDIIADVALAYSGDVQIELIVPGRAPSTYHDFLSAGGRGLHHFGYGCDDFDAARAEALTRGLTITTEGRSAITRFAYCDDGQAAGAPIVELIEMGPAIVEVFDRIKQASIGWDGSDPIRRL